MAAALRLVGGPAPYREAMTIKLEAAGHQVAEDEPVDVLVVYGGSEELWAGAAETASTTPTVVVLPELDLGLFVRALAMGAGAVHIDNPTGTILDVIVAALSGEALLPLAVTQALAGSVPSPVEPPPAVDLLDIERQIADGLLADHTIQQISRELNYSDRTIRRRLQGLYLKLGVPNRTGAVAALRAGYGHDDQEE